MKLIVKQNSFLTQIRDLILKNDYKLWIKVRTTNRELYFTPLSPFLKVFILSNWKDSNNNTGTWWLLSIIDLYSVQVHLITTRWRRREWRIVCMARLHIACNKQWCLRTGLLWWAFSTRKYRGNSLWGEEFSSSDERWQYSCWCDSRSGDLHSTVIGVTADLGTFIVQLLVWQQIWGPS